ncbi:MAG: hypothetical protein LBV08_10460, partial [Clostridiales bacterium]|nr:hypothetical protein [Clostridiales bacterium]
LDYLDITHVEGKAYSDNDFFRDFAEAYGNYLATKEGQTSYGKEYQQDMAPFEELTFILNENGTLYKFAKEFWEELSTQNGQQIYGPGLYSAYPGYFVNEEASQNFTSDFSNSFAEFVVSEKPEGDSVIDQKIKFFYGYPEFVSVRERLRPLR